MKALAILALLLAGCGSSGGSSSPVQTHPLPGGKTGVTLTLAASFLFPEGSKPQSYTLPQTTSLAVPASLETQLNSSEPSRATVYFGSVQVYYKQETRPEGTAYYFLDSTGAGVVPGSVLAVNKGEIVTIEVQSGYVTQNTRVQAAIQGEY